jgi:ABC-type multidrug transport system fused ATPase/permease subunit
MLIMLVFDVAGQMMSFVLDEKFSFGIRKNLYEQIINATWLDVKGYHTGDLMTRVTSDAGNIANGIIYTVPTIIELFIELIITFFTLYHYQPILAFFALIIGPLAAVISFWLGRKLKRLQVKVQESESAYRSYMQESLANLLIVKSFANEKYAVDRLVELRDERFKWVYRKSRLSVISSTSMSFSFQVAYIVAFTYGAFCLTAKSITYGTMSLFLTLINRIQAPIVSLAQQIPKLVSILASAGRVIEIQNLQAEKRLDKSITPENIGVRVEDISFNYEMEKDKVFEDADVVINPGEFVAIIGESGIGKTTLIRLIMSFMEANRGRIVYFNDKGEEVPTNANIRELISYVPQGNTLFSGTIRENILMGKLDATNDELERALKMAAAYDFVMELPQGIDTKIGERGHGISEGQAQRIAIARALIRNAPFLILDEATSALDPQTELMVLKGIQELTPKPTCLIITHRLSVLPYCDRQIKIEDRQIKIY